MDRIPPLNRDQAHPDSQVFFDQDERAFGLVLNPTRIFAYRPPIQAAARALGRSVGKDAVLPAALRALICVRVATLVGCPFWVDINAAGSSTAGVSDEKIAALPNYATSPLYSGAERAALELADTMTQATVEVSDELFARLQQYYDAPALVELAATAAMENFRARFNRVFRIEPNSLYCPVEGHSDRTPS